MRLLRVLPFTVLAVLATAPAQAQAPLRLDDAMLEAFEWRSIGPANMMGRVTDIEGIPSPSKTWYFAAATGGVWKTTNNGTTFRDIWPIEATGAMGDLAIAPSDTLQIWAGTGEEDARNSIAPGAGIWKSTDGGMNWEFKGLEDTHHIGRIVVHPSNPDIVWVAAPGHTWAENPERGLYKTTNGGDSWELKKFVSNRAGFIDVA
ncbi:MAG: glycosyl hydrolase, partial [Gemmatimonadota bacterium]